MSRLAKKIVFTLVADAIVLVFLVLAYELTQLNRHRWSHSRLNMPRKSTELLVACFGDSHTFGIGALAGGDYPSQLKRRLRRNIPAGRKLQVLNQGEPGSNSSLARQSVRRFFEQSPIAPDVLIFCAGWNNIWNVQGAPVLPDEVAAAPSSEWYAYLLRNSYALRLSRVTQARLEQFAAGGGEFPTKVFSVDEPQEQKLLREWLRADLDAVREICKKHGTRLIVMNYWFPTPWIERELLAFEAETNTSYVNVDNFGYKNRATLRCPSELVTQNCHPNGKGYARIADILLEAVEPILRDKAARLGRAL
ncbi:SGNH/GDSL hydrolase family protein [bacterium]|nr:SGNH/GDSL hydrolase family protein [bacterium]